MLLVPWQSRSLHTVWVFLNGVKEIFDALTQTFETRNKISDAPSQRVPQKSCTRGAAECVTYVLTTF